MSETDPLIGARVNAVTFGYAHFQLHLVRADEEFFVSTSADVSCGPKEAVEADFRTAESPRLVALLGAELCGFLTDDVGRKAGLIFDNERQVRAWWPDKAHDNLFIVKRLGTDEWWSVG